MAEYLTACDEETTVKKAKLRIAYCCFRNKILQKRWQNFRGYFVVKDLLKSSIVRWSNQCGHRVLSESNIILFFKLGKTYG
jgi:hypothetical protein